MITKALADLEDQGYNFAYVARPYLARKAYIKLFNDLKITFVCFRHEEAAKLGTKHGAV